MRIYHLFFPRLQAPTDSGELISLTGGPRLGGSILVLPRSLFTQSRRRVPRGEGRGRQVALAQAEYETRYDEAEYIVDLRLLDGVTAEANIWSWDKSSILEILGTRNARAIPEPMARIPMRDGVRLVEAIEGYEGEVWHKNDCIASRWWPSKPNDKAWSDFIAGAKTHDWPSDSSGAPISFDMPEATKVPWRNDLFWVHKNWSDRISSIRPMQIILASFMLALVPISCESVNLVRTSMQHQVVQTQLEAMNEQSQLWLDLRRRALRDLSRVEVMSAPDDPAMLVLALMELNDAVGQMPSGIENIEFRDGELKVTLPKGDFRSVVDIVSDLEQSKSWRGVRFDAATHQIIGNVSAGSQDQPRVDQ